MIDNKLRLLELNRRKEVKEAVILACEVAVVTGALLEIMIPALSFEVFLYLVVTLLATASYQTYCRSSIMYRMMLTTERGYRLKRDGFIKASQMSLMFKKQKKPYLKAAAMLAKRQFKEFCYKN